MTKVLSLGGSIVAPNGPDAPFIRSFADMAKKWLFADASRRLIIVVGGGGPARSWQKAYRDATDSPDADAQDWIGIMATRLNAQLIKGILGELCPQDVVMDPSSVSVFGGRILVAGGWKPGFSTDYDAIVLAERFQADTVVNLSNISKVYTADPKLDASAKPLDSISWKDFRSLVGDEWSPGKNAPFDPIASGRAQEAGIKVICADGRDLANMEAILEGKPFEGTTIG